MAKQVAKAADKKPSVPPTQTPPIKKARQLAPPRAQVPFDPKDYDLDEEPEAVPETEQVAEPVASAPPVTSPPVAPAVPKPTHSPRLVRLAAELGITQADIEGLSNEQLIDEIVLAQRQVALVQETERRQAPRGPLHPEPAPPEPEDSLGLHEEVEPTIAAALKRLAKENKELKDSLTKVGEREKQREAETRNERIDRAFQSLTDYADVFGKGSLGELTPEELQSRQGIIAIASADQSKGTFESKIAKAVKTLFRRQAAPPPVEPAYEQPHVAPTNGSTYEDEELAKRRAVWNAATLAEPSNRKGAPEPKSLMKAKKTFVKGLQEIGLGEDQLAGELTAELPD